MSQPEKAAEITISIHFRFTVSYLLVDILLLFGILGQTINKTMLKHLKQGYSSVTSSSKLKVECNASSVLWWLMLANCK